MGRALILAAAALVAAMQGARAETLRLSPGESARIELTENPSTGFSWRIDARASAGLDRVAIADEGYKAGANMPGAPGAHGWLIRGAAPGQAVIQFVYQRPWEPAPIEARRVEVVVRAH
ncbi:protease inhibitor I42 family protein [Methylocystis sp. S23]|jgi:inhibitor of cysteine peptidase